MPEDLWDWTLLGLLVIVPAIGVGLLAITDGERTTRRAAEFYQKCDSGQTFGMSAYQAEGCQARILQRKEAK